MAKGTKGRSKSRGKSSSRSSKRRKDDVARRKAIVARIMKEESDKQEHERKMVYIFYAAAALCGLVVAFIFTYVLPPLSSVGSECAEIIEAGPFSWVMNNAGESSKYPVAYQCAKAYQDTNGEYLALGFVSLYVTMQTFSIPGTVILSLLAAALFGVFLGEILVAMSCTSGAVFNYLLSKLMGTALINLFKVGDKVDKLKKEIEGLEGTELWIFMALMRMAPFPNIVINLGAPHIGVPIFTFFTSTLLGLIPLNTVQMMSGRAVITGGEIERGPVGAILVCGTIALCVAFWNKYYRTKYAAENAMKKLAEKKKAA